jgi:hypothetical protein
MLAWNLVSHLLKQQEYEISYGSVGVSEATSELAILGGSSFGRAYTETAGADLSAAGASAVGISDASAGGELLASAVANILGTGSIRSEGHDGNGDC